MFIIFCDHFFDATITLLWTLWFSRYFLLIGKYLLPESRNYGTITLNKTFRTLQVNCTIAISAVRFVFDNIHFETHGESSWKHCRYECGMLRSNNICTFMNVRFKHFAVELKSHINASIVILRKTERSSIRTLVRFDFKVRWTRTLDSLQTVRAEHRASALYSMFRRLTLCSVITSLFTPPTIR